MPSLWEEKEHPLPADAFDGLIEALLEGPYWVLDVLPRQVEARAPGQYAAVERYYLRPERLAELRRKYAEILLRLNCYYDMAVSLDNGGHWERNPDPEAFAAELCALDAGRFLRVMFEAQGAMADLDPEDSYMTVYDPEGRLLDTLRPLAGAEGLFLWQPPEATFP